MATAAEVAPATLADRLAAETAASAGVVIAPPMVGASVRTGGVPATTTSV